MNEDEIDPQEARRAAAGIWKCLQALGEEAAELGLASAARAIGGAAAVIEAEARLGRVTMLPAVTRRRRRLAS